MSGKNINQWRQTNQNKWFLQKQECTQGRWH